MPQKRIILYAPEELYKQLKSVLALQGLSNSEWFRQKMKEEVTKK